MTPSDTVEQSFCRQRTDEEQQVLLRLAKPIDVLSPTSAQNFHGYVASDFDVPVTIVRGDSSAG